MNNKDIQAIVKSVFFDDYNIVGETNLHQLLIAPDATAVNVPGGHDFDIQGSLEIVAAGIIVIRQLNLLYEDVRRLHKQDLTPRELADKLNASTISQPLEVAEKLIELAQAVIAASDERKS